MERPWENENLNMNEAEKIIVMKRYRAALLKEARGILSEAQLEKRDLTTAEEKRYNALDKEIDEVGLLHDVAEAKLAEERKAGEEGAPLASGRPYPQAGGNSALDDRGRVIPLLTHEQRMSDHVKEQAPEELRAGEATTGRIIRGMLTGWQGLDAERRALVGYEDPKGGYLLPSPLSARFIDLARSKMVLSRAGAVTVPVDSDSLKIPKLLADPTPYWRGELQEIAQSDPTFGAVILKPKTVAILTLVSYEVWEDAAGLGRAVEDALSAALALEIDRVGLLGGGEGNANEPTGIYYTDGIGTVEMGTNGDTPTDYSKFLDAIEKIEDANGDPATLIYNPSTKRTLAGLTTGISGDNTPLKAPADVEALRRMVTTAIPNDLAWGSGTDCTAAFLGGFPNVYMGMRQQVRIDVSHEAGDAFGKLGLYVRAFARVDFAIIRPAQLVRIVGITKGDNGNGL